MNRRSFLWQSLCSSVPFFAGSSFAEQVAAHAASKPSDADLAAFARGLTGPVFHPGDAKYEQLRKGYAAKYAAHPALIVHPVKTQDIRTTLEFAQSHHLPLAVRCGGHSYAGYSTCEGGLVFDMSGFGSIEIAADKSRARIGGGMLCGKVDMETAKAGVATVLGQCSSVGVGGFLLGGGLGPLMGKHGLGCDNVLAAELVLADGRVVKASASENPDLYWAIRGGGGNFGVVTAFEMALHPVTNLFAGDITLEAADPREFLRAYRECVSAAPEELTLIARIWAEPKKKPQIEIQACYLGDEAGGERALAALRRNSAVVHDTMKMRPYLELEQMVPADIPPSYHEHCGGFFAELDDRRIEALANAYSNVPTPADCFLTHLHGAVTRVPVDATAFPLRRNGIACDAAAYWTPPDGQKSAKEWTEALKAALPVDAYGTYVNGLDREGESSVRHAYGVNYARLQHIKARYDPHNVFSLNQNIRPA